MNRGNDDRSQKIPGAAIPQPVGDQPDIDRQSLEQLLREVSEGDQGEAPLPRLGAFLSFLSRPVALWALLLSMFLAVVLNLGLSLVLMPKVSQFQQTLTATAPTATQGEDVPLSPIPSRLQFTGQAIHLPADGQAQAEIQVVVLDQFDQPAPDGTEVTFEISPLESGSLSSKSVRTQAGHAQTLFTAGQLPGDVLLYASIAGGVTESITVHLDKVAKAELKASLVRSEPADTVELGEPAKLFFSIENTGNIAAFAVRLHSTMPEGATYLAASDNGLLEGNVVKWEVGDVAPAQATPLERWMEVRINDDWAANTIASGAYWLTYEGGQEIAGDRHVTLSVGQQASALTVTLSADPSSLVADGVSTSTITLEVTDSAGNPIVAEVQATLSTDPPGIGVLAPGSLLVVDGRAQAVYTAGQDPGNVTIIASTGTVSGSINVLLEEKRAALWRLRRRENIYATPQKDGNEIAFAQLPQGTIVELLPEGADQEGGASEFEHVAVLLWIPEDRLLLQGDGQAGTIIQGAEKVFVGQGVEDPLNVIEAAREIWPAAAQQIVPVVSWQNGLVQIRFEGWVLEDAIEQLE